MPELQQFEGWRSESTEELIALEGKYRLDSLVGAFEEALRAKDSKVGREALSEAELVVLTVAAFEREMKGGGYAHVFRKSSKAYAPYFVDSLDRIGCHDAAEHTQQAIYALGIGDYLGADAIDRAMAEENEDRGFVMDACTDEYLYVADEVAGALFEYIKANRGEIVVKGEWD
jgi:hypothetical protein